MKALEKLRASVAARKAQTARHRLEVANEVVAIVAQHKEIAVTHVLPKYMRMVADLKHVIKDLREDQIRLEGRANTCAYNNTMTYVNRLTGETTVIKSFAQAQPHLHQLAKDIRNMQDVLNAFEPHPDYKAMRSVMKARTKSAA